MAELVAKRGSTTIRIATIVLAAAALVLSVGAASSSAAPTVPSLVLQGAQRLDAALHGTIHTDTLCGQAAGLVCTQVVVPLDRTGQVPGSVTLHVEELPAAGTPRGVIFLIAGGPGQGSAHTFALGDPTADALYHYLFPGFTLVAYDDRGTGASGLLDCPPLQEANDVPTEQTAAAQCGAALGPSAARTASRSAAWSAVL